MSIEVEPISYDQVMPWLLKQHYAKRGCPISFAFGAFRESELVGVVTYGTPASSSLRAGVCGDAWIEKVLELNRLCCENTPIGRSKAWNIFTAQRLPI